MLPYNSHCSCLAGGRLNGSRSSLAGRGYNNNDDDDDEDEDEDDEYNGQGAASRRLVSDLESRIGEMRQELLEKDEQLSRASSDIDR